MAIQQLVASKSFATTHSAIAKLTKHEGFSESQVNDIVDAALTNNQVNWIIGDSDVLEFISKIAFEYKDKITEDLLEELKKELAAHEAKEDNDDDLQF